MAELDKNFLPDQNNHTFVEKFDTYEFSLVKMDFALLSLRHSSTLKTTHPFIDLLLTLFRGGGGQKRLWAPSLLNFDKNNHRMRLQIGCNFNLVYCRETEAKKMRNFLGEPPF